MSSRPCGRAANAIVGECYDDRIANLIARGLLFDSGFGPPRLGEGPIRRKSDVTSIWTGLLVRPESGLWLLAMGALNRRAEVTVRDAVIASSEGYTPLIRDRPDYRCRSQQVLQRRIPRNDERKSSRWGAAASCQLRRLGPGEGHAARRPPRLRSRRGARPRDHRTLSRVFGPAGPIPKETAEQLPFVMAPKHHSGRIQLRTGSRCMSTTRTLNRRAPT